MGRTFLFNILDSNLWFAVHSRLELEYTIYKNDQIKEALTSLSLFNALLPTADTVSFD